MSTQNKLDCARPLDVWIWSNKPEIRKAADYIFLQLSKKVRILKKSWPAKIKNHLKVILTDLFVAHRQNPKLYLAFSRDMAKYVSTKRYRKIYLHPQVTALVTDFLAREGYIEYHKGVHFTHFSRMARMKASPKLLRYFRRYRTEKGIFINRRPEIILRDENKKEIDVDFDTIRTKTMLRNVRKINKFLENYDIDLDFSKIEGDISDFEDAYFAKNNKKYVRIFNNSSFDQGGRFYCHWSQRIPKVFRKYITIDGAETVELDYSCLHITMLYGIINHLPPPGDLYTIEGMPQYYREIVKKSFNISINAGDRKTALLAIHQKTLTHERNTGEGSPKPTHILSMIEEKHPLLTGFLCTGYGVYLQNKDSDIAEKILLHLSEQWIPCLTIHDSFIVKNEHKNELRVIMQNEFYNMFNFYPLIK